MKHTMLKCLSIVMALATLLSVCAVPALAVADTCQHNVADLKEKIGYQAATCTEPGAEIWECSCGKYVTKPLVKEDGTYKEPALGHDWVEDMEQRIEPTYAPESGKSVYECSRCDATKTVLTTKTQCPEAEHNYVLKSDSATCSADGVKVYECDKCFKPKEEFSARKGHNFGAGVEKTPAVCGRTGAVYTFTCATCDKTVDETMPLASNQHKWLAVEAKAATCTEAGNTKGSYCVICNLGKDGYRVIPALGHDYDKDNDGVDEPYQDADHLPVKVGCVDGVTYYKCNREDCGYIHEVKHLATTDPNGNHNPLNAAVIGITLIETKPTCLEDGYYTCTLCNQVLEGSPATGHGWGDLPNQIVAPTCSSYGYSLWFCFACGEMKKDNILAPTGQHVIPATGTIFVDRTCTEDAYSWYICDEANGGCGEKQYIYYTDSEDYETTYKALGHDMKPVEYQAADCSKLPVYQKQVSGGAIVILAVEQEKIDAINALLVDNNRAQAVTTYTEEVVAAVEAANGHTAGNKCDRCGYGTTSTVLVAGHTKSEEPVDIEATCTVAAHKSYVCTACEAELEIVPDSFVGERNPENHKHTAMRVTKEPTCTTTGTQVKFCLDCGTDDIDAGEYDPIVPALGHLWGPNTVTKQPTCYEKGTVTHTCIRGEVKDPETGAVITPSPCGVTETVQDTEPTDLELLKHAAHILPAGATVPATGTKHALGFYYTTRVVITPGSCVQLQQVEYTCAGCGAKFYTTNEDYLVSGNAADLYGQHNKVYNRAEDYVCSPDPEKCENGVLADGWTCARCGEIKLPTTVDWHHTEEAIPAVAPTHTVNGSTAGVKCADCGKILEAPEVVEAEGHTWEKVVAVIPGCEIVGNLEYYKCTGTDNDDPSVEPHACTAVSKDGENTLLKADGVTPETKDYFNVAATGHNFEGQEWIAVAANCYQDGYLYQVCKNGCAINNKSINTEEFYYGHAAHTYVVDESKKEPTCGEDGVIITTCSNVDVAHGTATCTYRDEEKVADALGHTNAAGQKISLDCTVEMDRHCVTCDKDIEPNHDVRESDRVFQPKGCGLPNRFVWACTKCNTQVVEWIPVMVNGTLTALEANGQTYQVMLDGDIVYETVAEKDEDDNVLFYYDVPKYDLGAHAWALIENGHKDATYTEAGYNKYHCAKCGADKTDPIPMLVGVDFSISIANNNAGQEIVDGALIAVKVATTTSNYGLVTLNAKLAYNTSLFTYVGFEANNAFGEASGTATNVDFTKNQIAFAVGGVVNMQSIAEDADQGALKNDILDGTQTYMTLYFRVAANAYQTKTAGVATFTLQDITATKAVDDPDNAGQKKVVDVDAAHIINNDVEDLANKIYKLGDINNDDYIFTEDLVALQSMLLIENYDALIEGAADLDQDGAITICDFALMQKKIVDALTYEELVAVAASGSEC
ncbi:MAG: dockerin type I repeat-containing protein [Clostridia bacterium]|nr:dockerin type I repeat-containing protein [Clostridia bacterium]